MEEFHKFLSFSQASFKILGQGHSSSGSVVIFYKKHKGTPVFLLSLLNYTFFYFVCHEDFIFSRGPSHHHLSLRYN